MSQINASPKSKVIVPDKFVESAGKDMFSGTDSLTRFPARSHLLVARSLAKSKQKATQLRLVNPTKPEHLSILFFSHPVSCPSNPREKKPTKRFGKCYSAEPSNHHPVLGRRQVFRLRRDQPVSDKKVW